MYNRNESRGNERFYDLKMAKKNKFRHMPDELFQRREDEFGGIRGFRHIDRVSGPSRHFSETISSLNSGFPKGNPGTNRTLPSLFAGSNRVSFDPISVNDGEFSEQFPGNNREFPSMRRMGYSSEAAIGRPGGRFPEPTSRTFQKNRQEVDRFPAPFNKFKRNYGNPAFKSPNYMVPKKAPKTIALASVSTEPRINMDKILPQVLPEGLQLVEGQGFASRNQRRNLKRRLKQTEDLINEQAMNVFLKKGIPMKRPVSDSGTLSPAAIKKPRNTAMTGDLQSNDGPRVIKMAVVDKSHPDIVLDEKQAETIQNELITAIDIEPPGSFLPQFLETEFKDGVLYVLCANDMTKAWLAQKIDSIKKIKEDMNVFVVWHNNLPKRHLVTVWIPGTTDVETIKKRINHQNPTLRAENWLVKNQKVIDGKGSILTFSIHNRAFVKLKSAGFMAFWGLGTVAFNAGETLDNENQVIDAANKSESLEKTAAKKEDAGNCLSSQEDSTCKLVGNTGSEKENGATQVPSQGENIEGSEKKPSLVEESEDHSEALETEKKEESSKENIIKPQEIENKEEGDGNQSSSQGSDKDKTSHGD